MCLARCVGAPNVCVILPRQAGQMDGCPVKFGCWLEREEQRERESERLELSVNQHHDPATNDANLLIDGSSCTYYYTLVITVLAIFSA